MLDDTIIELDPARRRLLPEWTDIVKHLLDSAKPTAVDLLERASRTGRPLVQPRCGVGDHRAMVDLLRFLNREGRPDLLSVTIDSHTRLRDFGTAARVLADDPGRLNGYPLVAHGWERGRELNAAVPVPLEVRHGSPDGRELFAVTIASGITSFEGGGIGYNLPYAKDVPITDSLRAWRQIDAACGALAQAGIPVERELFGTLTAVLMPPSVSLAIALLEARLAAEQGVRFVSIAYPQTGETHQDIAALRAIPRLASRYLPGGLRVFPVLHEYMGVFPGDRANAEELVLYGGLVGRLGNAAKVISKTAEEALGIPDATANATGLRLVRLAQSHLLDFIRLDESRIAEELDWIEREVAEIVEPVLAEGDLLDTICRAFAAGTLDVPFSASRYAHSAVIPMRDPTGAVRYHTPGRLPLSRRSQRRNHQLLAARTGSPLATPPTARDLLADINYFSAGWS